MFVRTLPGELRTSASPSRNCVTDLKATDLRVSNVSEGQLKRNQQLPTGLCGVLCTRKILKGTTAHDGLWSNTSHWTTVRRQTSSARWFRLLRSHPMFNARRMASITLRTRPVFDAPRRIRRFSSLLPACQQTFMFTCDAETFSYFCLLTFRIWRNQKVCQFL